MLLRLLHSVVMPGDNVVAVHVQHSDDTFDPNTFHIHEDLCKSKQVRNVPFSSFWLGINWMPVLKNFVSGGF